MSSSKDVAKVVFFVLFIVAMAAACVATDETAPAARTEGPAYVQLANIPEGSGVFRVYDSEKDVFCWIYQFVERGGIHCIPARELVADAKD